VWAVREGLWYCIRAAVQASGGDGLRGIGLSTAVAEHSIVNFQPKLMRGLCYMVHSIEMMCGSGLFLDFTKTIYSLKYQ